MTRRRPAHRPTKFTPDTVKRLLDGVRAGLPYQLAAEAAGISISTFNEWQRGEFPYHAKNELKAYFLDELTRAKGESALRNIALISNAAKEDWRAAAWILERRFPNDFGKQSLEITGSDGGPIQIEAMQLQQVILKALDGHPEARITVAEALQSIDSGDES